MISMPQPAQSSTPAPGDVPHRLVPIPVATLPGFDADDHLEAFAAFRRSAEAVAHGTPPLRIGQPLGPDLCALCEAAVSAPSATSCGEARRFFEERFDAFLIEPRECGRIPGSGFVTGYYEPVVPGSLERAPQFIAPVLRRPSHFERLGPGVASHPYPRRGTIEADAEQGRYEALVWLRDWVEVFFIQVQGSGRIVLPDGRVIRLVYDGRNGHPYTSVGPLLIEAGDMSLERVKAWLRAHGQQAGDAGRQLMQRNRSYVFFRAEAASPSPGDGPIGGAGIPLIPLRSIAVDRAIWPYGLPFWIDADLPWRGPSPSPFRRLIVAQDTGSAILGPARADLFFGSGDAAGQRAGDIRHPAHITVLLPRPAQGKATH